MIIYNLAFLLTMHYVADYMCQTTDMAVKKWYSLYWLLCHLFAYGFALTVGTLLMLYFNETITGLAVTKYILLNLLCHLFTDAVTSRWIARLNEREDKGPYYKMLGFDQLIHTVTLLLTYKYIFLN